MEIAGKTPQPLVLNDIKELTFVYNWLNVFINTICEKNPYIWNDEKMYPKNIICGSLLDASSYEWKPTTISDVDVMIPIGSDKELKNTLQEMEIPFVKYGTTIHALHVMYQVDFTIKPFLNGEPTPFAIMSSHTSAADHERGLKGVWHKLLWGSMTAAYDDADAFSIAYGIRPRDKKIPPAEYVSDLRAIMELLFNRDNDTKLGKKLYFEEKVEDMGSVEGLIGLSKKFHSEKQRNAVINKFQRRIDDYSLKEKFKADQEPIIREMFQNYVR